MLPAFIKLETDLDFGSSPHPRRQRPDPDPPPPARRARAVPGRLSRRLRRARLPGLRRPQRSVATGYGPHPMNKRGTLRISTAIAYLGPARDRPNLTIRADTDVRRVVFQDGNVDRRRGASRDGASRRSRRRQVVLACGAIHTPPSSCGRASVRARCSTASASAITHVPEGVGQHMQDHPAIGPTLVPKPGVADWDQPVIQTTLRYTATGSSDFNDMQLEPLSFMHIPATRELLHGPRGVRLQVVLLRPPGVRERGRRREARASRWTTSPTSATTPSSSTASTARWNSAQTQAIASVSDGVRRPTRRRSRRPAGARARGSAATPPPGAHPSCTARMGPDDDPTAVVDERGMRPRRARPAHRRRVDHAARAQRQHQHPDDHDRRAHQRVGPGGRFVTAASSKAQGSRAGSPLGRPIYAKSVIWRENTRTTRSYTPETYLQTPALQLDLTWARKPRLAPARFSPLLRCHF